MHHNSKIKFFIGIYLRHLEFLCNCNNIKHCWCIIYTTRPLERNLDRIKCILLPCIQRNENYIKHIQSQLLNNKTLASIKNIEHLLGQLPYFQHIFLEDNLFKKNTVKYKFWVTLIAGNTGIIDQNTANTANCTFGLIRLILTVVN